MKRSIVSTCLVSILLGAQVAAAETRIKVLDVPVYGQQWNVWCWATSAQMVIDYLYQEEFQEFLEEKKGSLQDVKTTDLPRTVRQCEIVNQRHHSGSAKKARECLEQEGKTREDCLAPLESVDCCADNLLELKKEDRELCVNPGFLNQAIFEAFGLDFEDVEWNDDTGLALEFNEFVRQIDSGSPLVFIWQDPETGAGHMMIAVGYVEISSRERWMVIHNPWPPPDGGV